MLLFVVGAVFGEGQVLLFVAGAALGEGQVLLYVVGGQYSVKVKCYFLWQAQHLVNV